MSYFDYQITEHIATLSTNGEFSTQLNRVAYNGYPPKLDLRKWRGNKPLKGTTLSDDEARKLLSALQDLML